MPWVVSDTVIAPVGRWESQALGTVADGCAVDTPTAPRAVAAAEQLRLRERGQRCARKGTHTSHPYQRIVPQRPALPRATVARPPTPRCVEVIRGTQIRVG